MMERKPRDNYLPDHERKTRGIAFSTRNKFQVVDDPSETFPIGGFFGRYDFLASLSYQVWPEGLVVCDYRAGEAGDELVVRYKDAEREGSVDKFLVSNKTGWVWKLSSIGGFQLVRQSEG